MANEITKRLVFDEIKSQALKEAGRAHILADKYIGQLTLRAEQLEDEIDKITLQLEQVKQQAEQLRQEAFSTQQHAEHEYAETLKIVLQSFGLELPVNAKLHYEDGIPVAAEILDSAPNLSQDS